MESRTPLDRLRRQLGDGVWGAALVTGQEVALEAQDLPEDGDVELGSVSKAVTGLLLHDAVDRGVVSLQDRLQDHLPLAGSPAGPLSLGAVATHAAGLPRLPTIDDLSARSWRMWRHGANPYGDTLEELLEQTRRTTLRRRTTPAYSNLGFELLGHAVAGAQGTTYAALVRERIADPLGLDSWYVPSTPDELRPTAVVGSTGLWGRTAEPWTGEGLGPAGGLRSTLPDAARWVAALLAGEVPGSTALEPVAPMAFRTRIGAAWMTTEVGRTTLTWHNGMTGGHAAYVGLDRSRRRGVVVVRARARSVDDVAVRLLRAGDTPA